MSQKFDIDTDPPSEELLEFARKELRETPEIREAAILELRALLKEATDLHYKDDDEFLLIFLRPCHFYPESALKMMRRIAEFKKSNHNLLHNLMPEDEKRAFTEHNVVNVMANRDQKGRRVLLVNCGQLWDPKAVSSEQLFRLFYIIHLLAQLEPETQINGAVVIMDFDGLGMKQVKALSPSFSKLLLTFIQEALPLRLKEVHIIKQPFIFKMVWALFTPFIKEKLNKRIFFHGNDMRKIHKFIDPEYLPGDYGGTRPFMDYGGRNWFPCVFRHIDHINDWNTFGFVDDPELQKYWK
ncbi:cellular retinaldehyde-binding protein [Culex quinquefasciatus]|uniref:Cellular retinaldehyde-binding protein n=3 Tax=Culex pipiens complex TaxID=518105 RepID=B0X3T6_CULQU|nr:clavesin-1 isoform X1 [Culex quinquefasciatus]XP_039430782.1 clavesin-1-like isoform X1 [Culex pipiens pallens]XP_052564276.1 clavesin-1-like isoform X1 [Culex pipiens pallens]EDS40013.1 cellular retinaldehyde-binding protein [Culex quinquefasciatus]|eukprot:XP_001864308.1 cellular retinaldehyde-binding protein [Culex quinquefasciatus]